MTQHFFILVGAYDASSVKRAEEFVSRCRDLLESNSKLFWVAFQSNMLSDLATVDPGFKEAFEKAKKQLAVNGWVLPMLQCNMRNQNNIANINVEKGTTAYKMQTSVNQLPPPSSVVGEVPLLFNI